MRAMGLNFDHIPIFDHHAHPFLQRAATDDPLRFQRWFTESTDATIQQQHVPHLLVFRTAVRWLAEFLGCEPTVAAILAARAQLDERAYTARLFADANIGTVLCDYGYGGAGAYDHAAMQAMLPCPVHPVLRLERLAEELIVAEASFEKMIEAFNTTLAEARTRGVVAFKSIVAYRTGLCVEAPDRAAATQDFAALKELALRDGRVRLARKALCDYLLHFALAEAARQELPFQFHTGFGDSDADLRAANPLHLRSVIEGYPGTPLVLLHAGWPFFREVTHLAAIYPNVWLDISLAVPFATTGIPAMLRDILGMAPFSKVIFATDAFTMPEIYWVAARWGRWGLAQTLGEFVAEDFLTTPAAERVAQDILGDNARRLYQV
jgi:predicted TIM-barrel fold metal-dependent hydrolase